MKQLYNVKTLAELRETAASLDCVLVEADPCTLLLDVDLVSTKEDWEQMFREPLALVREKFGAAVEETWASRGGGLHVRLSLTLPVSAEMAIALQAALGSDPRREVLACWERLVLDDRGEKNVDTRSLFRPRGA
jgi:hypothetical protein